MVTHSRAADGRSAIILLRAGATMNIRCTRQELLWARSNLGGLGLLSWRTSTTRQLGGTESSRFWAASTTENTANQRLGATPDERSSCNRTLLARRASAKWLGHSTPCEHSDISLPLRDCSHFFWAVAASRPRHRIQWLWTHPFLRQRFPRTGASLLTAGHPLSRGLESHFGVGARSTE